MNRGADREQRRAEVCATYCHLGFGPGVPYQPDGPGGCARGRMRNHGVHPGAPESRDSESVAGGPQLRVCSPPAGSGHPRASCRLPGPCAGTLHSSGQDLVWRRTGREVITMPGPCAFFGSSWSMPLGFSSLSLAPAVQFPALH